ncbi:helix-turn-helix domain-containing protein [Paenibacillus sp. PAMC21692]|uniref:helix-turn-helix domain-containing protein n=1 Tax=Paenibacillus sp. PAMC21692 TaxID=2762320 RepID=UPI00164DCC32|nr:helix-turn-helix domain-containing protein [Paenibacillus sp. PAMC21692]QNK58907.1 AraC family transcriptional regulator [Paenibacillus sp. PAMC21692]
MNKKSRLWRDYLISYVFIFAIPFLILGMFIYMNAVKVVQHEIEQANSYKLKQVQSYLDGQINGLKHMAAKMAFDQRLTPYAAKLNDYSAAETVKELSRYKDNSLILESVLLYFRNDDHIYSDEGVVSLDVLTKEMYPFPQAEREAFLHDLSTSLQITLKPAVPVQLRGSREERLLTYMFPIMPNNSQPYGTVLFLINESMLTSMMSNMLGNVQGAVYLLNEAGEVLAVERTEDSPELERIMQKSELKTGEVISKIGSTSYSVMSEKSELTGWTYMIVMPTDQFWYRVIEFKQIAGLVLLLVLVIGIVAAWFVSFKKSGPIRALVAHLQHQGTPGRSERRSSNEFDFIRGTVDDLHHYTLQLETNMEQQLPLVIDQMLYRALTGSGSEAETGAGSALYPHIQGQYYYVMVISYRQDSDGIVDSSGREALYRVLNRVEAPGSNGFGIELLDEQAIALVMSVREAVADTRANQKQAADTIQALLREKLGIHSLIGVGTARCELSDINQSFIEGLATIEYRLLFPEGHVLFFEDTAKLQDHNRQYSMGDQMKFTQSLRMADQAVCLDSLHAMLDNMAQMEQSVLLLRYICFDLVNAVLKEMRTLKTGMDWPETKRMMEFQTLEDLRESMSIVVVRICEHVGAGKQTKRADLCAKIIQQIDQGYRSDQLSLDMLAQQFDVSASYISRLIREQTGTSFMEYVQQLRIEAVKREMLSTDRPIKDIIIEAGYQDMSSFIKKFKKSEGLTPGEYRKKARTE